MGGVARITVRGTVDITQKQKWVAATQSARERGVARITARGTVVITQKQKWVAVTQNAREMGVARITARGTVVITQRTPLAYCLQKRNILSLLYAVEPPLPWSTSLEPLDSV